MNNKKVLIISDEFTLNHNFKYNLYESLKLLEDNNYVFEDVYVLFPITDPDEFKKRNKDFFYNEEFFNYMFNKGLHLYNSSNKNLELCIENIHKESDNNVDFLNFIFTHGSLEKGIAGIEYAQIPTKEPDLTIFKRSVDIAFSEKSRKEKEKLMKELYSTKEYKIYSEENILLTDKLYDLVSSIEFNTYFFYFSQCYSRNFSKPFYELKNSIVISTSKENEKTSAHSFNYLFLRNLRKNREFSDIKEYLINNFFRIYRGFSPNKHLPLLEKKYKEKHNLGKQLSVKEVFEFSLFLDKEIYCNDWKKDVKKFSYKEDPLLVSNKIDSMMYFI